MFKDIILGFVGLIVAISIVSSCSNKSGNTDPDQATMASIQCESFVKDQLKAPASADFPSIADHIYKVGDNGYRIESHVDAQNSFGANLRSNYTCEIQWNGKDSADISNWTLANLQIEQ